MFMVFDFNKFRNNFNSYKEKNLIFDYSLDNYQKFVALENHSK